jgi:hypothetical protein
MLLINAVTGEVKEYFTCRVTRLIATYKRNPVCE